MNGWGDKFNGETKRDIPDYRINIYVVATKQTSQYLCFQILTCEHNYNIVHIFALLALNCNIKV